jgi:hypothetical protein
MSWAAALLVFIASHLVGDFLVQTEWQAVNKPGGLIDPGSRRALVAHVIAYMAAFVPALVWVGIRTSPWRAVAVAAGVAIPHLVLDDGHLVRYWLRVVKRAPNPSVALTVSVDQTFHFVCLVGAAALAAF